MTWVSCSLHDVHKDQRIYLEDPAPYIPERKTGKGRTPSKHKTNVADIEVRAWAAAQPKDAWRRVTTRNTTKGRLEVDTGRDVGGTSGFHAAGATFFCGTLLSGCQRHFRYGSLLSTKLASVASPYGIGHDVDALYAGDQD